MPKCNRIKIIYHGRPPARKDDPADLQMRSPPEKCRSNLIQGKYVECIDIMEEIVSIKKNVYGLDHSEFVAASEKLCEYLNLAAMIHLQKEKFELTLDYLRKAELVARDSLELKATTYNNLACYYRRTGKIRTALSYLIQAL
jgi:tetratricopeptide (TPR) repeat protein